MHSITWISLTNLNIPNGTLAMVSGFIGNNPAMGRWAEYAVYDAKYDLWYPVEHTETGAYELNPPTHYIPIPSTDTICDIPPHPAIST